MEMPAWTPSIERIKNSNLTSFIEYLMAEGALEKADFSALYRYSITQNAEFWQTLIKFTDARAKTWGTNVIKDPTHLLKAQWFPDARLNYAENLLKHNGDQDAIVFWGEDKVKTRLSRNELNALVSRLVQFLRSKGVKKGDRVAGFVPNTPETIAAMLATAAIGGIWSSCSPDFGKQGVLDRFGQIEPKVIFAADGYFYNGKTHSVIEKIARFRTELPSVSSVVIFPYINQMDGIDIIEDAQSLETAISPFNPTEIEYEYVEFNHPLFIMYSSGTTGIPKAIVHGHGGTLLQHLKEHQLHSDIKQGDRMFYFTTCSWMMWNWLVSGLASGATLMLYDGSPFYPNGNILFDYAETEHFTFFGTSAKFIEAVAKAGLKPTETHDLSSLRTMASTGSPLVAESYDFVYASIKEDIHLASISGGTDIISCFVLGNPIAPVYRGEIQTPGLGMAVEIWDENGKPVQQQQGELVCVKPFPSQPVMFWNDSDGARYKKAYFDEYEGIWAHGDFAEITQKGGIIIYGRSDATLNPGGVRIGTAEIYRQVDQLDEILESVVIGQNWDNDVRVVLFVKLREGATLDEALIQKIKATVKTNCTPRHVPAKILQVTDIPRTKSGKIVEIPVRDTVHGRVVKNKEALANPEALEEYANRSELQS